MRSAGSSTRSSRDRAASRKRSSSNVSRSSLQSTFHNYTHGRTTEEELTTYLTKKFPIPSASRLKISSSAARSANGKSVESVSRHLSRLDQFRATSRRTSKKAILQRLSVPTYASMAKKKEKW